MWWQPKTRVWLGYLGNNVLVLRQVRCQVLRQCLHLCIVHFWPLKSHLRHHFSRHSGLGTLATRGGCLQGWITEHKLWRVVTARPCHRHLGKRKSFAYSLRNDGTDFKARVSNTEIYALSTLFSHELLPWV